jgi:hypothetical protein
LTWSAVLSPPHCSPFMAWNLAGSILAIGSAGSSHKFFDTTLSQRSRYVAKESMVLHSRKTFSYWTTTGVHLTVAAKCNCDYNVGSDCTWRHGISQLSQLEEENILEECDTCYTCVCFTITMCWYTSK